MIRFLKNILLFFIIFGLIFLAGILLPATPRSKNNMLTYKLQKDSLLINVESPRIIFMGGSNLVFGLDSQMIQDSLHINTINAGLAVGLGLVYMMDDILPYIREGDMVVLAPEYNHFYGGFSYGDNGLLRLLMDVDRSGLKKIRMKHIPNLVKSIPSYFISKLKIANYDYNKEGDVYGKHIFNQYGDSNYHWDKKGKEFNAINKIDGNFDYFVIDELLLFNQKLKDKKAVFLITYPSFQKKSYYVVKDDILKIQRELENTDIDIISKPEDYIFSDSLMFDQVYHLNKKGVKLRTQILIRDLKNYDIK